MKLGFVSSIFQDKDFEEVIDFASDNNYECVEVACWPSGRAERRYAGVSHIDAQNMNSQKAEQIKSLLKEKGVEISALAFYPNPLDSNEFKREHSIQHLLNLIDCASMLSVKTVTTFFGRDQYKSVEENLRLAEKIWTPVIQKAESNKIRIAIENCPMLFGEEQWPGGQNLMTTPVIWRKIFNIFDSEYFGLNFDPSHFVWQMMDYISPLYEFRDKIFHIHFKDIKLYKDRLFSCGTMAYPLDYMSPKLVGIGDIDWGSFVSALTSIGYDDYACIEIEDKAFENSEKRIEDSLKLSQKFMKQYVI